MLKRVLGLYASPEIALLKTFSLFVCFQRCVLWHHDTAGHRFQQAGSIPAVETLIKLSGCFNKVMLVDLLNLLMFRFRMVLCVRMLVWLGTHICMRPALVIDRPC